MPSSLREGSPCAFGYSPRPPVSDCGTVTQASTLRGFSRQCGGRAVRLPLRVGSSSGLGVECGQGFASPTSYALERGQPAPRCPLLLRPPFGPPGWGRNINLLSIAYAFRPRLRDRLTLGGLTFPRKPWAFGEWGSHPLCRYSCRHNHFQALHHASRSGFTALGTLPYRHPVDTTG